MSVIKSETALRVVDGTAQPKACSRPCIYLFEEIGQGLLYCTCKNTSVICTYSSPPPLPPIPEHALGTVCLPILQHLHHRVPHLCRHLLCEDGPGCGCEGCSWSGWRGARGLGGGVLVVWVEGCSWAGKGEASPLLLDPLNSILEDGSILIDALCSAWWPLAPQAPSPCMPPAPLCMPPPPHTHTRPKHAPLPTQSNRRPKATTVSWAWTASEDGEGGRG